MYNKPHIFKNNGQWRLVASAWLTPVEWLKSATDFIERKNREDRAKGESK